MWVTHHHLLVLAADSEPGTLLTLVKHGPAGQNDKDGKTFRMENCNVPEHLPSAAQVTEVEFCMGRKMAAWVSRWQGVDQVSPVSWPAELRAPPLHIWNTLGKLRKQSAHALWSLETESGKADSIIVFP